MMMTRSQKPHPLGRDMDEGPRGQKDERRRVLNGHEGEEHNRRRAKAGGKPDEECSGEEINNQADKKPQSGGRSPFAGRVDPFFFCAGNAFRRR